MATGIVALAADLQAVPLLPMLLFWLNVVFFGALLAATAARILRYPDAFAADLRSHGRGVGSRSSRWRSGSSAARCTCG